ncbi:threonine aldolase family protein [Oceanibacterium hippocampi]|uniref:L-threonine aldolase n=1 Tax=Oceanibacterium hippocampi TaxID=745714 RepID=A0A1Y5U0I3_9PROT|nr:low specificity L-threonine aldolase [Oceanibacterium hippocampi]SLN73078.1 Low specificity L-threonine aldolase [Oceanibacterium hippocampi]
MNFASDNTAPVCPEIMEALARANHGNAMGYGDDEETQAFSRLCSELFEREVLAFPVGTGGVANALALSVLVPPYGAIYCQEDAHIDVDECGGPEFFTGGAKIVPLPSPRGKLDPAALAARIANAGAGVVHHVQPAAVSITQATELGTVYSADEIAAIAGVAKAAGLPLHMDGARFANAVAAQNCSAADLTWKAGVDVLSFGATKNGAMAAEAVIFFDPGKAGDFAFRRKRAGQLYSKMRYISAQLRAYVTDDLWLRNARHANAMAARLADGLGAIPGVELLQPVEANELFLAMPGPVIAGLQADGFRFYVMGTAEAPVVRLVTAWNSEAESVAALIASARAHAGVQA